MTTPTLDSLSVSGADRWQLARATASFQALIAWDHAWTGAAESEESPGNERLRMLPILAAEVQRGLGEAHDGAAWLYNFVLTAGAGNLSGLVAAQAEAARKAGQVEFADLLEEFGAQIGELIEAGYNGFMAAEVSEQRSLSEKLTSLLAGSGAGDLSLRIRCNLADLTIVAGLVSAVVPPHAHAVGIIAAGSGARTTWKCKDLDKSKVKVYHF